MTLERQMRAFRSIGGYSGGTSRLARAPQRLLERDIRPISAQLGCIPPDPLPIHDTFDRGSYPSGIHGSTSTSGHTWTEYRGDWLAVLFSGDANPATSTAYNDSGDRSIAGFDYGTTDVHLAARWVGAGAGQNRGIVFRYNGTSAYLAGHGQLTKFTNIGTGAGSTNLATYTQPAARQVMEVVMLGDDIEVLVDGVTVASVTDSPSLSGTRGGIYQRFAGNEGAGFYDFGYPYNGCEPDPVARVP